MPRAPGGSSAVARASINSLRPNRTRVSTQAAARLRTSSRAGPSSRSEAKASTLGARMSPLGSRRATGPPPQHTRSCESNTSSPSGEAVKACRRAGRSWRSARSAALSTAFWSAWPSVASGTKRKPSMRPRCSPSTVTSPAAATDDVISPSSRNLRTSNAARLSTNLCIRRWCNTSDSLSSIARARSCQCTARWIQSARCEM